MIDFQAQFYSHSFLYYILPILCFLYFLTIFFSGFPLSCNDFRVERNKNLQSSYYLFPVLPFSYPDSDFVQGFYIIWLIGNPCARLEDNIKSVRFRRVHVRTWCANQPYREPWVSSHCPTLPFLSLLPLMFRAVSRMKEIFLSVHTRSPQQVRRFQPGKIDDLSKLKTKKTIFGECAGPPRDFPRLF